MSNAIKFCTVKYEMLTSYCAHKQKQKVSNNIVFGGCFTFEHNLIFFSWCDLFNVHRVRSNPQLLFPYCCLLRWKDRVWVSINFIMSFVFVIWNIIHLNWFVSWTIHQWLFEHFPFFKSTMKILKWRCFFILR